MPARGGIVLTHDCGDAELRTWRLGSLATGSGRRWRLRVGIGPKCPAAEFLGHGVARERPEHRAHQACSDGTGAYRVGWSVRSLRQLIGKPHVLFELAIGVTPKHSRREVLLEEGSAVTQGAATEHRG